MIDIHCHILPAFDDGAADLAESVAMARLAVNSGVTALVATPHFRGEEQSLELIPKLLNRYERLSRVLRQQQIPLRLYPGAEILCLPETVSMARRRQLPTIGDTRYLLTEFFFNESAEYMTDSLTALAACGYRPVVAHPERYEAVQQFPELLERWFAAGFVLQQNKGSTLGAFGPQVQKTALWMLDSGLAHIIASDAHSIRRRTTDMIPLRQYLLERCPSRYVDVLLEDNPARLVRDQDMVPTE